MKTKRITHTPFREPVIVLYQCPAAVGDAIGKRNGLLGNLLKIIGIKP
jgi:hypothetical protein